MREHTEPRAYECPCLFCEFGRALREEPLDRHRLTTLWDAVIEHTGWDSQIHSYLLQEAERFCGRLDAPTYLREALHIVKDERRKLGRTFMGRA